MTVEKVQKEIKKEFDVLLSLLNETRESTHRYVKRLQAVNDKLFGNLCEGVRGQIGTEVEKVSPNGICGEMRGGLASILDSLYLLQAEILLLEKHTNCNFEKEISESKY